MALSLDSKKYYEDCRTFSLIDGKAQSISNIDSNVDDMYKPSDRKYLVHQSGLLVAML